MSHIVLYRKDSQTTTASAKTVSDVRRCGRDLGFREVEMSGNLLRQAYQTLKHIGKRGTAILVYPRFISPISSRFFTFRLLLLRILAIWKRLVFYVVDLPIDQHVAALTEISPSWYAKERRILKLADCFLVFGDEMKNVIAERYGLADASYLPFGLLDYMTDAPPPRHDRKISSPIRIVFAGTLRESVMGDCIRQLPKGRNIEIEYHFYGSYGEWISHERDDFFYHGVIDATEIVSTISPYDYGLILGDLSNMKLAHYLRLGPTSKFSLYMAAGLPIIAPMQFSYGSAFIAQKKVGVTFDKIENLDIQIEGSLDSYAAMMNNVIKVQKRVVRGDFFKSSIVECI